VDLVVINAFDLQDAWFQCLDKIMDHGRDYLIERGSFEGHYRKEFDMVVVNIEKPENRPLIPDIPPSMSDIAPPTTMDYVEGYFANYLMYSKLADNEQYTYGNRIAASFDRVVEILKKGTGTNQAIMEIARPEDIELTDPPCLRLIDCKVLDGQLNFVVYFRSWDLWSGFPANLAGIQLLKEHLAEEVGLQPGRTVALSKGMHLYDYVWELARRRTYRDQKQPTV
jgi:thymidylate synthase